jgi:hypothetical protein
VSSYHGERCCVASVRRRPPTDGSIVLLTCGQVRVLAGGFGIVLCAMVVAGCDYAGRRVIQPANTDRSTASGAGTRIPLPTVAQLAPQPEPDCEFRTTDSSGDDRQKLDYERQCYRHAEMIVRARLRLLQRSVAKTIRAIKHCDGCGAQSAGLAVLSD